MHILYTDGMARLHHYMSYCPVLTVMLSHLDILILLYTIKCSPIHQLSPTSDSKEIDLIKKRTHFSIARLASVHLLG